MFTAPKKADGQKKKINLKLKKHIILKSTHLSVHSEPKIIILFLERF